MAIINADAENFEIETISGNVVIDFWAPWCGPCKVLTPILHEVDEELGDQVKIVKVNADENPELASQFQVMSIPSLFLLKDGHVVGKSVGVKQKDFLIELITDKFIIA